ncbi:hypothetical protein J2790_003921 [Paenarthrobacter nicotinovorans]|nr:hypothetical protein [Paenarthrobacter nicotinovorans]SCZ56394.1 hypothetical protein SAMN02799638_01817 [Arthrobacter sp. UNCCL28]
MMEHRDTSNAAMCESLEFSTLYPEKDSPWCGLGALDLKGRELA